jgi:chromosome segregation ATPase
MQKAAVMSIAVFLLIGCTIMHMQAEIKESEQRIAQKEARLRELEAERTRLEKNQALLVEKLDRTRLTAQQLNEELDRMIRQHRHLAGMAEKQGQDIEAIKQEIAALEGKQELLSQTAASGDTDAAKAQKISELQQEIRNYLLLGLKSKHRKNLQ